MRRSGRDGGRERREREREALCEGREREGQRGTEGDRSADSPLMAVPIPHWVVRAAVDPAGPKGKPVRLGPKFGPSGWARSSARPAGPEGRPIQLGLRVGPSARLIAPT